MLKIIDKMANKIKGSEVAKNSLIYVVSSVVNASIPFFLLPLMTSYLTPADYGVTAMFQVVLGFIIPIIGMTSEGATGTEYFRNIFNNLPRYIGNALMLVGISFAICFAAGALFVDQLSSLLEISQKWVLIAIIQSLLQFITMYALALWQVSKQPIKYGIFQISLSLLNAGLSIWFVYGLLMGYEGRLLGNFIAIGIFAVIAFIYIVKKYKVQFKFDKVLSKDILKYGVPLIPHALGGWAMALIDRVFLADMIGLETVGLYSVAFQLASVFGFLTLAINQSFAPWLYEQLTQDNSQTNRTRIVKFSYLIMAIMVAAAAVYFALIPIVKNYFINIRYHDGLTSMFFVLLIGFVFQGFYFMFTNYIGFVKKTKYQAMVTVIIAILKFPATYLLIKHFGAIGAAMSFTLIYFLFFSLTAIVSNKIYPMPWISFRNR